MGRIRLLHLFRRPDQHEVQQHMPVVDEPVIQPSLKPASSVVRNTRAIPQDVKIEVAVRDGGRCRQCGSNKELHFDHVIPWSKGGPNTVDNIHSCAALAMGTRARTTSLRICHPRRTGSPGARLRPTRGLHRLPAPISHHHPCRIRPSRSRSRPAPSAGCSLPSTLAPLAPATGESIRAPSDP
jgi:hypothetical protein